MPRPMSRYNSGVGKRGARIDELHPGRAVLTSSGNFGVVEKIDLRHKNRAGNPDPWVYVRHGNGAAGWTEPRHLRLLGAGRTKTAGHWSRKESRSLTVPEKHQLRIARQTLKLSDAGARIMGGPSKSEARRVILDLTGKSPRE